MIITGVFNVKKLAIWHAIAPIYGAMTVIITDMLPWTGKTRYHYQAHWHATEVMPSTSMIGPPLDITVTPDILTIITRIDPCLVIPYPTHITIGIGVVAIMTPKGATPGYSTDLPSIVSHATEARAPTTITVTHCPADLHPIGNFSKMTVDPETNPKNNMTDARILIKLTCNTLET